MCNEGFIFIRSPTGVAGAGQGGGRVPGSAGQIQPGFGGYGGELLNYCNSADKNVFVQCVSAVCFMIIQYDLMKHYVAS